MGNTVLKKWAASLERFEDERLIRTLLIIYFIALVFSCFINHGFLQADEHYRALEPAHQLVYGYATLPWELDPKFPIVSYLLGVFFSPVLFVTKFFGFHGLLEASFCKIWVLLFSFSRIFAFRRLLVVVCARAEKRNRYLVFFLFLFCTPILFTRTSQENMAATALIWALALLVKERTEELRSQNYFFGAALLSLAVSFRLQLGFSALGLGIFLYFVRLRKDRAHLSSFVLGGVAGLLPLALVDLYTFGKPFLPAYNYLQYALGGEEGGHVWGTSPWYEYFLAFFTSFYPPFSLILFVFLAIGISVCWPFAAVFVPFVVVHTILAHKEIRYFAPILPVMDLLMIAGFEKMHSSMIWQTHVPFVEKCKNIFAILFGAGALLGLAWCFIPLDGRPQLTEFVRKLQEQDHALKYTLVVDSRTVLPEFYLKNPDFQPIKMDTKTFFNSLEKNEVSGQNFALSRVDLRELSSIDGKCVVKYVSLNKFVIYLMSLVENVPRRKRVDMYIECGSSR